MIIVAVVIILVSNNEVYILFNLTIKIIYLLLKN